MKVGAFFCIKNDPDDKSSGSGTKGGYFLFKDSSRRATKNIVAATTMKKLPVTTLKIYVTGGITTVEMRLPMRLPIPVTKKSVAKAEQKTGRVCTPFLGQAKMPVRMADTTKSVPVMTIVRLSSMV